MALHVLTHLWLVSPDGSGLTPWWIETERVVVGCPESDPQCLTNGPARPPDTSTFQPGDVVVGRSAGRPCISQNLFVDQLCQGFLREPSFFTRCGQLRVALMALTHDCSLL
ncbi:hypothetical protein BJ970_007563 [Saccharopolyspora phatthalungensis]|uniref:Uncharacterized protein n=1 Tax=Saccharopolyspora phatthalungensis TaxID=664693 RepID=A0A840QKZ5_9PSEU|nr:hypothetical protein [Saccharopolyspora phatthalungensis]MBB5159963.1 hypothetical protein [Saccharopolyspora phatthalungensis]